MATNISTGDDWHDMGRALREKGLATRRAVLGSDYVDAALSGGEVSFE